MQRCIIHGPFSDGAVLGFLLALSLTFATGCGHHTPDGSAARDALFDPVGIFVVDGNSHTQSRHGAVAMPQNVLQELGNPPGLELIDQAHSGHGMVQMRDRVLEGVDPLHRPGQVNLLLYWEGVHDLYQGFSVEETYERLREYGIARRRAGFTVATLSLLPAREKSTPPTYEQDRQAVNALLRLNWREFADAFVDVGADPEMGDPEAPKRGVYYSHDRVHMTDAGSERVAQLVADALRPLLGQ